MSVEFAPVTTEEEITYLAQLADEIWHEYWPSRIGSDQTDYMIEQFQSYEAIKRDMAENDYEYWFICTTDSQDPSADRADTDNRVNDKRLIQPSSVKNRIVGFTGGHNEPETNRFFISKVYLLAPERGRGFASKTIAFYNELCKQRGLHAMYLTVNKENELGIRAYKGKGFVTIDATETDIGSGFIMDDYIMEKSVE